MQSTKAKKPEAKSTHTQPNGSECAVRNLTFNSTLCVFSEIIRLMALLLKLPSNRIFWIASKTKDETKKKWTCVPKMRSFIISALILNLNQSNGYYTVQLYIFTDVLQINAINKQSIYLHNVFISNCLMFANVSRCAPEMSFGFGADLSIKWADLHRVFKHSHFHAHFAPTKNVEEEKRSQNGF